jgi:hypothetical protein
VAGSSHNRGIPFGTPRIVVVKDPNKVGIRHHRQYRIKERRLALPEEDSRVTQVVKVLHTRFVREIHQDASPSLVDGATWAGSRVFLVG